MQRLAWPSCLLVLVTKLLVEVKRISKNTKLVQTNGIIELFIMYTHFKLCQSQDGHGRTPQGGSRGGGQNRFSKNLIFERFAAKFFPKVSRGFSEG